MQITAIVNILPGEAPIEAKDAADRIMEAFALDPEKDTVTVTVAIVAPVHQVGADAATPAEPATTALDGSRGLPPGEPVLGPGTERASGVQ